VADDILTDRGTADYLKLSDEQFAELQARPRPIPSFEPLPGVRRYRLSDVKAWLDESISATSGATHPEQPAAASLAASTGEALIDLPWGGDLVVGEAIAPLRTYPHAPTLDAPLTSKERSVP
jgi:hypothetical protein